MTPVETLRALLAKAMEKCGPLPWRAADPGNVVQLAVAEVFNALSALLDVAEAAERVRAEKRAFLDGIHHAELGGRMPDSKGLSEADAALFAALDMLGSK